MTVLLAVPPIPADAATTTTSRTAAAAKAAADEEFWQPLGALPFQPSSIVSDGQGIYAVGEGKLVRVPIKNGSLGSPVNLPWPKQFGTSGSLSLGRGGLYATVAEEEGAGTYRAEINPGGSIMNAWRAVAHLQGQNTWAVTSGSHDRIWLSHAGVRHWVHWLDAVPPGGYGRREFNEGVNIGGPRVGSTFVTSANHLFVLGGQGSDRKATMLPLVKGTPGKPREITRLPVPMVNAVAAVHASMLYAISQQGDEVRVDRATIGYDGTLNGWAKLVGPRPGPAAVAAVAIQGLIVIARADGTVEGLSVAAVAPGRRVIKWSTNDKPRSIRPGQTITERIPWNYEGPEEIDSFSAWTYATGKASKLADDGASLAGTHIEAGGGTGRELVLVITVPKGSKRRDYWSIIMLKTHDRPIGRILRIHHINEEWRR
jgi:hypothetical protein